MLSSKIVHTNSRYDVSLHSQQGRSSRTREFVPSRKDDVAFPTSRGEHVVKVHGGAEDSGFGRTSSQERIILDELFGIAASDVDLETMDPRRGGISKMVGFEVVVSESRMETRSALK